MSAMVFNPLGGIPQLQLRTAEELASIGELDRARWAATSVPIDQLFCDPGALAFLDADHNGRVRVDEVLAARAWLWERLSGREGVTQRSDTLRLADLDVSHTDAKKVRALAERLLAKLGTAGRDAITLEQVRQFRSGYAKTFPNGDGVVAPSQIVDPAVAALAIEVVAATGGALDAGGEAGARAEDVDAWVGRCGALLAWRAQAEGDGAAIVLPLGADTAAAVAQVQAIAPKVAQYFAQCALLGAEAQAGARLQATTEELAALDVRSPAAIEAWLDQAPLAPPRADGVLDLTGAVNPRYRAALDALAHGVAARATGGPVHQLTAATWGEVLALVQPHIAWQAAKPAGIDEALPAEHLQAVIDGPATAALRALIAEDSGVADELQEFNNLEQVVLYQRWLLELANNFVSFQQLFAPDERALFEAGTLILDGRKLTLCTHVLDIGAHKAIAGTSGIFIAYVSTTRKDGDATQTGQIAAAVTAGSRGGIGVGKRGVFYDRDQREWDALITDVVAQPISVWEAMIEPVDRIRTFVADKVTQLASSKQADMASATSKATEEATQVPAPPPAPPAPAPPAAGGGMQNMLMGGGLAIAAVGSSLAFVVQALSQIDPVGLLFGLGSLVLGLMAVSGFIGWLKLRRRDLSTLLEASGWALNGRMYLTFSLGSQFTEEPPLPKGHTLRLTSAQVRKRVFLALALLAALATGLYVAKHPEVLDMFKPAPAAPPAAPAADAPPPAPAG